MTDFQRQITFVKSLRQDAKELMDRVEAILADENEYTELGGQPFFEKFFSETSPGITEYEFNEARMFIVDLKKIGWSALYKIKG